MNFTFWFWIIVCWGSIILAFVLLMRAVNKFNKEQECRRNHPAGKQLKIELSPTGQINETSLSVHKDIIPPGTLVREFENRARAHHLQGD